MPDHKILLATAYSSYDSSKKPLKDAGSDSSTFPALRHNCKAALSDLWDRISELLGIVGPKRVEDACIIRIDSGYHKEPIIIEVCRGFGKAANGNTTSRSTFAFNSAQWTIHIDDLKVRYGVGTDAWE
jgi:hypothetical protein